MAVTAKSAENILFARQSKQAWLKHFAQHTDIFILFKESRCQNIKNKIKKYTASEVDMESGC